MDNTATALNNLRERGYTPITPNPFGAIVQSGYFTESAEEFRAVYARWRAAYPWLNKKRERIDVLVQECPREKLPRLQRHLSAWCAAHFTFDKQVAA